jgi:hypothetical protein
MKISPGRIFQTPNFGLLLTPFKFPRPLATTIEIPLDSKELSIKDWLIDPINELKNFQKREDVCTRMICWKKDVTTW